MTREAPDPVLTALSELEAPAPREARDAMVRARCHAAMTATARQRRPPAPAASRAFDRLLPVAVVVYAIAVVAEAIRIGWLSVS
jgi:hypothetical protein